MKKNRIPSMESSSFLNPTPRFQARTGPLLMAVNLKRRSFLLKLSRYSTYLKLWFFLVNSLKRNTGLFVKLRKPWEGDPSTSGLEPYLHFICQNQARSTADGRGKCCQWRNSCRATLMDHSVYTDTTVTKSATGRSSKRIHQPRVCRHAQTLHTQPCIF